MGEGLIVFGALVAFVVGGGALGWFLSWAKERYQKRRKR